MNLENKFNRKIVLDFLNRYYFRGEKFGVIIYEIIK